MEHHFWLQKWQKNEIGFHLPNVNPSLVEHFHLLNLKSAATPNFKPRILLPLCGKTLDIDWLLAQGYSVAGAELSRIAIEDLFKNLNLTPVIKILGEVTLFSAANIDVFLCDIFKLTSAMLGTVHAVYDRAALVALPSETRKRYTAHLSALTNHAPQLLICFEYDQNLLAGPPFSINEQEVRQHYQDNYAISLLASKPLANGIKGLCPATEHVWRLTP